ncbi:MAG: hypothetical protein DRH20_16290 [Deltaproteobacteria bacterium]|nr:MAG: hypothetical protein DRH20_16290 [Deltaproteobacteria bacterium]
MHCETLSANRDLLEGVRDAASRGMPIYAECGGFMFLMHSIRDLSGREYPMAGVFPMVCEMEPRLRALGYREITTRCNSLLGPPGTMVRGHEFHYSNADLKDKRLNRVYEIIDRKGNTCTREGFVQDNVLGSYIHLHWGSNPRVAQSFVDVCRRQKDMPDNNRSVP